MNFFANVARISPGYNMHLLGCLLLTLEYVRAGRTIKAGAQLGLGFYNCLYFELFGVYAPDYTSFSR